jgi:hypothetical protein
MQFLVIRTVESRVDYIKWRGGVQSLPEHRSTVYIVKEVIEFIRLIRMTAIVVEYILSLLSFLPLSGRSNRNSKRLGVRNSRNLKR